MGDGVGGGDADKCKGIFSPGVASTMTENNCCLFYSLFPKDASNFCSGSPLLSLVDFFQWTFIAGFRNNFQDHRLVYGTTFRDTGSYQKAGTSFLRRVTGRNFTLS
jgi:hypothetical protein